MSRSKGWAQVKWEDSFAIATIVASPAAGTDSRVSYIKRYSCLLTARFEHPSHRYAVTMVTGWTPARS